MPDYKPSEVHLDVMPLVATMHKAEREQAAACLVLYCQEQGEWCAARPPDIGEALMKRKDDWPVKHWNNPFFRPDIRDMVESGYARFTEPGNGAPVEFTEKGFAAMSRWVRREEVAGA